MTQVRAGAEGKGSDVPPSECGLLPAAPASPRSGLARPDLKVHVTVSTEVSPVSPMSVHGAGPT